MNKIEYLIRSIKQFDTHLYLDRDTYNSLTLSNAFEYISFNIFFNSGTVWFIKAILLHWCALVTVILLNKYNDTTEFE